MLHFLLTVIGLAYNGFYAGIGLCSSFLFLQLSVS